MTITQSIFDLSFMLTDVSFKIGLVNVMAVRVAPTGETEPMGDNGMSIAELHISTGKTLSSTQTRSYTSGGEYISGRV